MRRREGRASVRGRLGEATGFVSQEHRCQVSKQAGAPVAALPAAVALWGKFSAFSSLSLLLVKYGANGSTPKSHTTMSPWVSRGTQGLRVPPEMGAVFTPMPRPRVANFSPQPINSDKWPETSLQPCIFKGFYIRKAAAAAAEQD